MKHIILICCALLVLSSTIHAQKFIQMDMFGKKKAMRFHVGDELRFKVKGDDKFYILPIVDLDATTGKITLPKGAVFLHEIAEIQVLAQTEGRYVLGTKLFSFGATFLSIGIIDALAFGSVFGVMGSIIGGATTLTGALLRWAFKKRGFKINERRQLRILNLNIEDLTMA